MIPPDELGRVLMRVLGGQPLDKAVAATRWPSELVLTQVEEYLSAGPLGLLRTRLSLAGDRSRESAARLRDLLHATELAMGVAVLALVSARVAAGQSSAPPSLRDVLGHPVRGTLTDLLRDLVLHQPAADWLDHPVETTWPAVDGRSKPWQKLARSAPWYALVGPATPPGRSTDSAALALTWWRNLDAHVEVDEDGLDDRIDAIYALASAFCTALIGDLRFSLSPEQRARGPLSVEWAAGRAAPAFPAFVGAATERRPGEAAVHILKKTRPRPYYHTNRRTIQRPDLSAAIDDWLRTALTPRAADGYSSVGGFVRARAPGLPRLVRDVWARMRRCVEVGDRAIFLVGEAGVGKSVLAGQLAEHLSSRGRRVVAVGPQAKGLTDPSALLPAGGWLIVDALDEHPRPAGWVNLIHELLVVPSAWQVCVTSRPGAEVEALFGDAFNEGEGVTRLQVGVLSPEETDTLLAQCRARAGCEDLPRWTELGRDTQRMLRTPLWLTLWVRQLAWRATSPPSIPMLLHREVVRVVDAMGPARPYLPAVVEALIAHGGTLPIDVAAAIRTTWAEGEGLDEVGRSAQVGPVEALLDAELLRVNGSGAYSPRHRLLLSALVARTRAPETLLAEVDGDAAARDALLLHLRRFVDAREFLTAWHLVEGCPARVRGPLLRVLLEGFGELESIELELRRRFFRVDPRAATEAGGRPPGMGWTLLSHPVNRIEPDPRSAPPALRTTAGREAMVFADELTADHEHQRAVRVLFAALHPLWAHSLPLGPRAGMDTLELRLTMRLCTSLHWLGQDSVELAREWLGRFVNARAGAVLPGGEDTITWSVGHIWPIARDSGAHASWLELAGLAWRLNAGSATPSLHCAVAELLAASLEPGGVKHHIAKAESGAERGNTGLIETRCRIALFHHFCGDEASGRHHLATARETLQGEALLRAMDRLDPEATALAAWVWCGLGDPTWAAGKQAATYFRDHSTPRSHRDWLIRAGMTARFGEPADFERELATLGVLSHRRFIPSFDLLLATLLLLGAKTDAAPSGPNSPNHHHLGAELDAWKRLLRFGSAALGTNLRRRDRPEEPHLWGQRWARQAFARRLSRLPNGTSLPEGWSTRSPRELADDVLYALSYDTRTRLISSQAKSKARRRVGELGPRLGGLLDDLPWLAPEPPSRARRSKRRGRQARSRRSLSPRAAAHASADPTRLLGKDGARQCVDCDRATGNWCDGCEHLGLRDYPPYPNRPFCTVCEETHGVCRYCRG